MRILYVAHNYQPMNASSITTHGIIKRLMNKGHEITLLVPKRCSEKALRDSSMDFENDTKVIVRTPTIVPYYVMDKSRKMRALILSLGYLFLTLKALGICKKRKFDLIISQHHSDHFASLSAFLLSRVFKLPLFVKTHDVYDIASGFLESLYLRLLDDLYRVLLRRVSCVFVVSNQLKLHVIQTHKIREDKVLVFPNAVDIETFKPTTDRSFRQTLRVESEKISLFVGGITEDRGLELLVKALPRIITERSDLIVLIVGVGPQRFHIERMAMKLGVERFVKFIPPLSYREMPKLISVADVTVGPLVARLDTLGSVPRKVLEYMACAKPVVACRGGVSSDLIINGYNGFLTSPGDAEELATITLKVMNSSNLAKEIGRNARKHVEKFYDWDRTMDDFEKALYRFGK